MTTKKQKTKNRWIDIIFFMLVSVVLFINNFTDLLTKFDIYVQVQWVTWIALIGVVIYTIIQAMNDNI